MTETVENAEIIEPVQAEIVEPPVRRSQRQRKPTYGEDSDYHVYLQETDDLLAEDDDPITYKQAVEDENSKQWQLAMEEEMKSMSQNSVWKLVKPNPQHNSLWNLIKWTLKQHF